MSENEFIADGFQTVTIAQPCCAVCPTPVFRVGTINVVTLLCTKPKGHDGDHAYIQEWREVDRLA